MPYFGIHILGFHIYETHKLTKFTNFHLVHRSEDFLFFFNLLHTYSFRNEIDILVDKNRKLSFNFSNYILSRRHESMRQEYWREFDGRLGRCCLWVIEALLHCSPRPWRTKPLQYKKAHPNDMHYTPQRPY